MADLGPLVKQRGRVKARLMAFSNYIDRIEAVLEIKKELSL